MEKIARYNRLLLAVIGTLLILSLLFGIGFALYETFRSSSSHNDAYVGVQRDTQGKVEETHQTQFANFLAPQQLDTGKAKFLIPVGQVNRPRGEAHPFDVMDGKSYSSSTYKYRSQSGVFNNFVLLDYESGERTMIFEEKLAITQWAYLEKEGEEVLLFKGTKKDFNKDKRLDQSDYQSLFVFYLSDGQLIEYGFESQTLLSFTPLKKTALVSLVLGLDQDGDRIFETCCEPQEIFVLNINSRNATPAVAKEMKERIQNTLDKG